MCHHAIWVEREEEDPEAVDEGEFIAHFGEFIDDGEEDEEEDDWSLYFDDYAEGEEEDEDDDEDEDEEDKEEDDTGLEQGKKKPEEQEKVVAKKEKKLQKVDDQLEMKIKKAEQQLKMMKSKQRKQKKMRDIVSEDSMDETLMEDYMQVQETICVLIPLQWLMSVYKYHMSLYQWFIFSFLPLPLPLLSFSSLFHLCHFSPFHNNTTVHRTSMSTVKTSESLGM